jgi:hypothetical protein
VPRLSVACTLPSPATPKDKAAYWPHSVYSKRFEKQTNAVSDKRATNFGRSIDGAPVSRRPSVASNVGWDLSVYEFEVLRP